jgi:hypothetical protein
MEPSNIGPDMVPPPKPQIMWAAGFAPANFDHRPWGKNRQDIGIFPKRANIVNFW